MVTSASMAHLQPSLLRPPGFLPAVEGDSYGQEAVDSLGQAEQTKLLFKCRMMEMQRDRLREMLWVVRAEVGIMLRLAERLEAKALEIRGGGSEEDCVMKDESAVSPLFPRHPER